MTTSPEFIEQKRVVLEAIKEETLKTINIASSGEVKQLKVTEVKSES